MMFRKRHDDDDLIVVDKPAGLLCIPGRGPANSESISGMLIEEFGNIFIVHRIDRDTSGLVVFAKNAASHKFLSRQFESGEVNKSYLAIVAGNPPQESGVIDLPIAIGGNGKARVSHSGRPSITHYSTEEAFDGFSFLRLFPKSGRQHQIRVHLRAIGCPLAVDPAYGSPESITIADIKKHRLTTGNKPLQPLLSRTPLHAETLSLVHPSGENIRWQSDIPKDMRATINQLRKWRSIIAR